MRERLYWLGIVLILCSAVVFALSTVFAKIASAEHGVPGVTISFFRFSFGLLVITPYMLATRESFKPSNSKFVIIRGVSNASAVMLFFLGIEYTTISNANILNMTYPAFVFLAAPFINKEKVKGRHILYLALTLAGGFMIASPVFGGFNPGDIFAFMSGAVAGIAISSLREARKYDSTPVILFYLMLIGTALNTAAVIPVFSVPPEGALIHIAAATLCSLSGQLLLTIGYRHIEAAAGSIVSTLRIPVAAALGVLIFGDSLSVKVVAGGLMIIISMIGISGFFEKPAVNGEVSGKRVD